MTKTKARTALDKQQAEDYMKLYKQASAKKKPHDETQRVAKKWLMEYAKNHPTEFDADGLIDLKHGKLRIGSKTEVATGDGFSLKKFATKCSEYLKTSFNTAMLKKAFESPDKAKEFEKLEVELRQKDAFDIV